MLLHAPGGEKGDVFPTFSDALQRIPEAYVTGQVIAAVFGDAAATLADPTTRLTMFVPRNAAWGELVAALNTTGEELIAQTGLVSTALGYHVLPNARLLSADAANGQTYTLEPLGEQAMHACMHAHVIIWGMRPGLKRALSL